MSVKNYENMDATELAMLVKQGDASASELLEEAISRCKRVNGVLNAVITEMFDLARDTAAKSPHKGPFAGVPFLMKDFGAEVAGVPFTEGTAFLSNYIPAEDSELYRRFCKAGLITFGKTNLPELAMGTITEPQLCGGTPCGATASRRCRRRCRGASRANGARERRGWLNPNSRVVLRPSGS